ncbi:MAG: nitroreductase family protein [candidate division WOR-3 bacterium]|nr:nitroreductase family protein [candidate division WOR-3 bacterium]MDH5684662.1 nitroreductase family protein [candidate division WOR-3 bacterium]
MKQRRSVRSFSNKPIPQPVIENCIKIAASAPSGANMQPWSFVLVKNKNLKKKIREEAEKVEKIFYTKMVTKEWRNKLEPLSTNFRKPFLEEAPYLICVFAQRYGIDSKGNKVKHYYVNESVGIAVGFLISALHQLGIGTLTYTPAPMTFLSKILKRPVNERLYIILVVGYPKKNNKPPRLKKKKLDELLTTL